MLADAAGVVVVVLAGGVQVDTLTGVNVGDFTAEVEDESGEVIEDVEDEIEGEADEEEPDRVIEAY